MRRKRLILAVTGATLLWAFPLSTAARESWNNPPRARVPELRHGTFRSEAMNVEVGYNICLPPEYNRQPSTRLPVIYYLHGYDGHESSYLDYADDWRRVMRHTGPVILVLVNGGVKSFFSDAPDRSVMGETVVRELIAHVDATYRTIPEASGRSLHGYSMGGFGALKLAFKFPELFGSVVAYGATLADAAEMEKHIGKTFVRMFGSTERFRANDPLALAESNAAKIRGRVAVQIVIGTKDEFLERNRLLHRRLEELKVPHDFVELPGVKHKKEPIYEKAAATAFQFSARHFTRPTRPSTLE